MSPMNFRDINLLPVYPQPPGILVGKSCSAGDFSVLERAWLQPAEFYSEVVLLYLPSLGIARSSNQKYRRVVPGSRTCQSIR